MRGLLAFLALAACIAPPDGDDRGGSVLTYAASIAVHDGPVRLSGTCSSACTMWLGHDDACLVLPATFGFHAVEDDITGDARRIYERHLYDAHPMLLAWYREQGDGREITRLSGSELLRNGWARECPAGQRTSTD